MLTTAMETLHDLLVLHPRAVIDAGVFIPCGLRHLLGVEDDEVLPRSAGNWLDPRASFGAHPLPLAGEHGTG